MKYRAIFISDVHMGMRSSQVEHLLSFLKQNSAPVIYLVGDILDFWALKKYPHWPKSYNELIHHLFVLIEKGTTVIYLPGNHDEFMELLYGDYGSRFKVVDRVVHTTARGERLLVLHGHQADYVSTHLHWLEKIGDWAYDAALALGVGISKMRRTLGLPYWSFSAWGKRLVKGVTTYIEGYQQTLKAEAKRAKCWGVVCGHIHTPTITRDEDGFVYANCGDWVESLSAIVEKKNGDLEIVRCA